METWENFSYMGNFSCFFSFSMRNSTPCVLLLFFSSRLVRRGLNSDPGTGQRPGSSPGGCTTRLRTAACAVWVGRWVGVRARCASVGKRGRPAGLSSLRWRWRRLWRVSWVGRAGAAAARSGSVALTCGRVPTSPLQSTTAAAAEDGE